MRQENGLPGRGAGAPAGVVVSRDPIARALAVVLARWHALEPGEIAFFRGYVRITHYSPCRRNVHFELPDDPTRKGWTRAGDIKVRRVRS